MCSIEIDTAEKGDDAAARQRLRALFDQAVDDYLSVDLWLEYAQWSISDPASAREVLERAIAACGLHVAKGCIIWDVYRIYETMLLDTMQVCRRTCACTHPTCTGRQGHTKAT